MRFRGPQALKDRSVNIGPSPCPARARERKIVIYAAGRLPQNLNAEDAENYAEVFSHLFSASSALLFAPSALKVLGSW